MKTDGNTEGRGALEERSEERIIEVTAAMMAVAQRAFEAVVANSRSNFIGGSLGIGQRPRGMARSPRRVSCRNTIEEFAAGTFQKAGRHVMSRERPGLVWLIVKHG